MAALVSVLTAAESVAPPWTAPHFVTKSQVAHSQAAVFQVSQEQNLARNHSRSPRYSET